MTRNKNRLFGRHFETVQYFIYLFFFLQNYDFLWPVHIWCKFQCKILVEKWFSQGGSMEPPWAPTGVKVPCRGGGKGRFNVATPTNATVACTAYVLPYNLQTKSI